MGDAKRMQRPAEERHGRLLCRRVVLGRSRLAFPAISTGVYGYPLDEAAEISIKEILAYPNLQPEHVVLCTFDGGHEYNEPFTKTFADFLKMPRKH